MICNLEILAASHFTLRVDTQRTSLRTFVHGKFWLVAYSITCNLWDEIIQIVTFLSNVPFLRWEPIRTFLADKSVRKSWSNNPQCIQSYYHISNQVGIEVVAHHPPWWPSATDVTKAEDDNEEATGAGMGMTRSSASHCCCFTDIAAKSTPFQVAAWHSLIPTADCSQNFRKLISVKLHHARKMWTTCSSVFIVPP